MKRLSDLFLVLIVLLLTLGISGCGYNEIQYNEEEVFKAWGDVESSYQRRFDLIPNLVEVVKGYAAHESSTFLAIAEAKSKIGAIQISKDLANDPKALKNFQQAQGELGSALSRLIALGEQYPELKASKNFADLQVQLEGTENRINVARNRYNEAVAKFNKSIRGIPNRWTNSLFLHLTRKEPFKADAGAEKAIKVKF